MGQIVKRMHRNDNLIGGRRAAIAKHLNASSLFGQKLRFGLDFHLPARIEEPLHDDHRRSRVKVAEKLAVRPTDALPIGSIDREDPGPNDILESAAESFDRLEDDLVASFCLLISVAHHRLSVRAEWCCPGNDDARATPHGSREPDETLVRGRRADATNGHFIFVLVHLSSLYTRQSAGQVNKKQGNLHRIPLKISDIDPFYQL